MESDVQQMDNDEKQYRLAEGYLMNGQYENAYNILIELEKNSKWAMNAQYRLGQMYYYGSYVEKNYEKAFYYLNKTMHPEAHYLLGMMYFNGEYVKQDYKKAYAFFSELEYNANAQYMLGIMYYNGSYVEKDYKKAYEIFSQLENNLNAKFMIGRMYTYGQYVDINYSKAKEIFNSLLEKNNNSKPVRHMLEMIKYFEDGTIPSDGIYY